MGLFSKLLGSKPNKAPPSLATRLTSLAPPSAGKPTYLDGVAEGLAVDFHVHDEIEGVQGTFLTAVTEGLVSVRRQRELVLSVRLGSSEDPIKKMQDIVRFVKNVHAWAGEGNLVDEGGFTQFGARGLFGRANSGVLYADARPLPGIRIPERALAAIAVDAQEIAAALDFGAFRVLTRIGMQLRFFPFPIWADLERSSAMTSREGESRLAKVPRLRAPGVTYLVEDRCLSITLPNDASSIARGLSTLPEGSPFALLVRPAADANAILVWTPGQKEMSGISPEGSNGSKLSGSCLMIVPGTRRDQALQFEDGYSLQISFESWARLGSALAARRELSLPLADDMRFEIKWLPKEELEPVRTFR